MMTPTRRLPRLNARLAGCVVASLVCCLAGANPVAQSALAFLEHRVAGDPDDYVAWNQLVDRYLEQQRETGDDTWLEKATEAAESSLKAFPEKTNPGGLAA